MNDCNGLDVWTVTTTVGSLEEARTLAHALVLRRLAACVQVEPVTMSVYRWEGGIHEDPEFRLVIKTAGSNWAGLEAAFAELHPYELPQCTGVAMVASASYAAWVRSQTT